MPRSHTLTKNDRNNIYVANSFKRQIAILVHYYLLTVFKASAAEQFSSTVVKVLPNSLHAFRSRL
jgi:hypothetical protein